MFLFLVRYYAGGLFLQTVLCYTRSTKRFYTQAMANDILYLLLRASITASLSNREAFIDKVSKVIEKQMQQDPETAQNISNHIAGLMERLDTSLMLQQLFTPRRDKKLDQALEELTTAIEKLNALLEEAGQTEATDSGNFKS